MPPVADNRPDGAQRPAILIVDDYEPTVELLRAHLQDAYEVGVAFDGETALVAAEATPFDLVLLDVRLPGMDGYQVCERLKHQDATRFIPIIMLTAMNDTQAKIKALEMGADDFLIKPCDVLELSCRVKNLIRLKRLLQSKIESERRLKVEAERRRIMRDVIFAFTLGKLVLAEPEEMAALRGSERLAHVDVRIQDDVAVARAATERSLGEQGMDLDRVPDFVLCVSESVTNALKHADGGTLDVYRKGGVIQAWIHDQGGGIAFADLPRSTLMKGYSSKISLGYGFSILLEIVDRVVLCTGTEGTDIMLEMALRHPHGGDDGSLDHFLRLWQER